MVVVVAVVVVLVVASAAAAATEDTPIIHSHIPPECKTNKRFLEYCDAFVSINYLSQRCQVLCLGTLSRDNAQ